MLHSFLLTSFGDSQASGISALGLNLTSFLIQIGTFVIAFLILRKWAFKPMLKILKERRDTIEQGVSLGEKMKKDEAEMEEKVQAALAEARKEADGIIADASERGQALVTEAETKAKVKAEQILASAEERIEQDRAKLWREMEAEFTSLLSDATEAVIDEKIDAKKDASLIDRALKGASK